ncbi:MAG: BON domain-containing protein [Steroidobacteraceae bacterium]
MSYPPNRNRNEEPEERDQRHRREREFERDSRDYPSEFGNYPRRPDDRDPRRQRWDEERGPRSFLGDPPRDRFRDPYADDAQRPLRIPGPDYGGTPTRDRELREQRAGENGRAHGGEYAGRGPKNYRRSDERICEDACDRLTQDPHVDASEIQVSVKDGEITLEGTVAERRMKHIAEDCIESVSGARQVHNRLRVERPAVQGAEADPARPGKRNA